MDYNTLIKEKLGKLLFLEIEVKGFKEIIKMPDYVALKNKDLYIPISPEYITKNVENEIKIKNLPIYYFVEGMFFAMGADENIKYIEDYETILTYIKDTDSCIKSLISNRIKEDKMLESYILLKGYYRYTKEKDIMQKILVVGENIYEKDKGFRDNLMADIDYCEKHLLKIPESYLYKGLVLKEDNNFKAAKVAINEYINQGGKLNDDIEILVQDINNISDYDEAVESINEDPVKTIKILVKLLENFESNPLIYYYLAVAYRKLENYEKAIYYLNESIQRESGIYEVIVEMGINYACIEDYETAINYFKKAFEVTKEVEICTNVVMCYLNLNNIEEAKIHLELAKSLNEEDEIVKELDKIING
ncbi:tetratricopeptide repeat protein [Clostridium sp.]|uniref:tetratricopeptide repeat protein n=1 Tax=Clostridium sp. TaxID=1506 RepID=UPI002626DF38|nr:tetratricopeptide repeat protein [Clostridium sp.]